MEVFQYVIFTIVFIIKYLGRGKSVSFLRLRINDFRINPQYILYYVNIAHLVITGIFPLASLIILNYLIYKQLVDRRKQVETLGKYTLL